MIDFTKSKQYTLSIRLSTDGFSFSIYNPIHDDSLSIIEKEIDTSSIPYSQSKDGLSRIGLPKSSLQTGKHNDGKQAFYNCAIRLI